MAFVTPDLELGGQSVGVGGDLVVELLGVDAFNAACGVAVAAGGDDALLNMASVTDAPPVG